jgi:hypothetical protein
MYNEEIYQKLLKEFGEEKMITVTDVITMFYNIKYNATEHIDTINEYDYERQWWMNKHKELINTTEVL